MILIQASIEEQYFPVIYKGMYQNMACFTANIVAYMSNGVTDFVDNR